MTRGCARWHDGPAWPGRPPSPPWPARCRSRARGGSTPLRASGPWRRCGGWSRPRTCCASTPRTSASAIPSRACDRSRRGSTRSSKRWRPASARARSRSPRRASFPTSAHASRPSRASPVRTPMPWRCWPSSTRSSTPPTAWPPRRASRAPTRTTGPRPDRPGRPGRPGPVARDGAVRKNPGMTTFPDSHSDLLDAQFATLATVGKDGVPQQTEVWFLHDDGELKLSLNDSRLKTRNLQKRPQCSLMLLDVGNPYRYLEVRGTAELAPDGDYAFANRVGAKYDADLKVHDNPGDSRVVVTIVPSNVYAVNMGG